MDQSAAKHKIKAEPGVYIKQEPDDDDEKFSFEDGHTLKCEPESDNDSIPHEYANTMKREPGDDAEPTFSNDSLKTGNTEHKFYYHEIGTYKRAPRNGVCPGFLNPQERSQWDAIILGIAGKLQLLLDLHRYSNVKQFLHRARDLGGQNVVWRD
jgi:hypothetical protein